VSRVLRWYRAFSALLLVIVLSSHGAGQTTDPLLSWNEGPKKQALLDFIQRVTTENSPDFVPLGARIAVFDNDGTLWPENPIPFQVTFALDSLRKLNEANPELATRPMVQAALQGNLQALLEEPHHAGLLEVMALTHAGMTVEEFQATVKDWQRTATHPRYGRRYIDLTYQPMQELLTLLRAKGFKTYIVSGGGADFMRVFSEEVYGIPPEQVVGSTARTLFELRDTGPVVVKTAELLIVDDKEGKPVGIHQFIGRRPIACFGNSDGDLAMLQYTTINNPWPSFGLIVHHTDSEREYAYDAQPQSSGKLVEALQQASQHGWTVVDMKNDWKVIFRAE
jgi:phosphoglycolate phosphatase-like HAD superfamily hydrolase